MQEDKKKTSLLETVIYLIIFLLIAFIILRATLNIGTEKPGSLFEKPKYTAQYPITLQLNTTNKEYLQKGDVEHFNNSHMLRRVYWSNGGYSTFDDCNLDDVEYSKTDWILCSDTNGREYNVKGSTQKIN